MGVEIILNHPNLGRVGVMLSHLLQKVRIIGLGSTGSHLDDAFTGQWLKGDEQACHTVALVMVVLFFGSPPVPSVWGQCYRQLTGKVFHRNRPPDTSGHKGGDIDARWFPSATRSGESSPQYTIAF